VGSRINRKLAQRVKELLGDQSELSVLEVGCGSISHLAIEKAVRITGMDISPRQLQRNSYVSHKILGDIQDYPLDSETYDIAVCWDVLEHLHYPSKALINICHSLKPNGLVVLAAPNCISIKGLTTKLTPHRAHVLFYRRIVGDTRAGKDDQGPFPTYLKPGMWPSGIRRFAEKNGLNIEYFSLYEGPVPSYFREKNKGADILFGLIGFISRMLTLNKVDLTHSDYIIVLRKPE